MSQAPRGFYQELGVAALSGILGASLLATTSASVTNEIFWGEKENPGFFLGVLFGAPLGYALGAPLGVSVFRHKNGQDSRFLMRSLATLGVAVPAWFLFILTADAEKPLAFISIPISLFAITWIAALPI